MNKYSNEVMKNVRQNLGLEENDTSLDEKINSMDKDEVFMRFLEWEGLMGWSWVESLKNAVINIYKK